ncbi:ATP-binding cassette domain-containing protein [Nitratireductor pacificus]|uniref:ABC transporter n=1 Tax=Nitratireductor pacificus pht-3B TaxID=391937 RepID=K2M521_9HYPH|nr:ATP-binding cassette domain-containing protein [Nitratireductor pacificus]EKF17206.1 ABC transporter [Nitratireductor pacificus pht-3B]
MKTATKVKTTGDATPNWDADPVLSVEHLTMRFGGLVAVGDLCFNVGRGDITALIGPNGAGKTTVFNCVTGFYKPTEGRIVMRHGPGRQDDAVEAVTASGLKWQSTNAGGVFLLERMPDHEISHKAKVARTFQNIRLFGGMTVLENLLVAQHNPLMVASGFSLGGILGLPSYKRAQQEAIDKAVYWLERTHLVERADDPAADLPYGDQRRLEIARAMCIGPQLLCLDEPAAGLNPRESAELNQLLKYIRDEHNVSVLLIEHDMGVVMEISDHVVVLDYGVKIADGAADAVKSDPKVIAAYLGVDDEAEIDVPEIRKDVAKVAAESDGATAAGSKKASARKAPAKARKPAARKTKAAAPAADTAFAQPLMATGAKAPAKRGTAKASARSQEKTSAKAPEKARAPKTAKAKTGTTGPAKTAAAGGAAKSAAAATPAKAKPATRKPAAKPAPAEASEIKIANSGDYPGKQPHGTRKPRAGGGNNLTRIKGIGPANEKKLNTLGTWHFDQIAAWKKAEIEWVGAYLSFPGRIEREEWVKQAKVLARGGETAFSKRVDKGDVPTSVPGRRGAQPKKTTAKGGKA